MEVAAKDVLVMNSFASIFFVVPISIDDLTQRFFILSQEGPTLVVLKTIVGLVELFIMDFDVANVAIILLVEGIVSHNTKSLNALARSFNVVLA